MFSTSKYAKSLNSSSDMKVKIDAIDPRQHATNRRFKISADIYQQRFLKFSDIAVFHSYHEFLYAGLLESNPNVTYFVPQPYKFTIGKRRYTPDFFYVKKGKRYVIEIKPQGELKEETLIPISTFLSQENIKFKVISNEKIRKKEQLSQNWLHIVRLLNNAEFIDTSGFERIIFDQCLESNKNIGDFVDASRRKEDFKKEIAIYRLAHKGRVNLKFSKRAINFDTKIIPCV